jgi:predicted  nucleic acid-binding Zn-ribbon protein
MSDNPRMHEDDLGERVRETEEQLEDAEKRLEEVEAQIDEAREHASDED